MSLLTTNRVRHAVVFTLAHADGSAEEADFLAALADLAQVPGVEELELMREVSPKNDYTHAVSMEFADRSAYEAYNEHPQHVAFVRDRWDAEVTSFMEIDTVARG